MVTQLGMFGWNVLPFGPKNAPPHFQNEMRLALGELLDDCTLVYIDDIIIFSDSFEEHIEHINKVKLLGKIVTGSGVVPDPDMIKDMQNFPPPKNGKQVLSF